jgi:hypothetical protein
MQVLNLQETLYLVQEHIINFKKMWLGRQIVGIFNYLEPLWLGSKDKVSIRRVLALAFSWDFINNLSFAIRKWEVGRSYADVAMVLGIEAGLIAALLTLTTYSASLTKPTDTSSGGD